MEGVFVHKQKMPACLRSRQARENRTLVISGKDLLS
jgi:hypothetical protein